MLRSYNMQFDGQLLNRGFWLYVWDVKGNDRRYVYVGRTGDTSSRYASSPFRRIGQHLDASLNAKGNALAKQLRAAGVRCDECTFEMVAVGPIFPEQTTWDDHVPFRDRMAAIERAVAEELKSRGYLVLGTHQRASLADDAAVWEQVHSLVAAKFPPLRPHRHDENPSVSRQDNARPPRLFTYTIPVDDGAAPNPFRGMCSLAICKPGIRRVAKEGDWIAGLGSVNAPRGKLSGCLVYAMRVEEVLSLEEYDRHAPARWPHRIPNLNSADLSERLGDCIYDYSSGAPRQRPSVHGKKNIETDLSGKNVLISRDFYYFGSRAVELPKNLRSICHQTQGHRSDSNASYFDAFVTWLRRDFAPGQMHGWPDFIVDWSEASQDAGCSPRRLDGENDEPC